MVTWTNGDELLRRPMATREQHGRGRRAARTQFDATGTALATRGKPTGETSSAQVERTMPPAPPRRPWREHWRAAFRARGDGSMDGWMCYCLLLGSARRPLHLHLQAPKALLQSPLILLLLIQSARLINNLGEAGRTSLSSASSSFLPSPGSTIQPPSHQLAEARPSAPTPSPSVPPPSSCPQVRPPPPLTGSKKNSRGVRSPSQQ